MMRFLVLVVALAAAQACSSQREPAGMALNGLETAADEAKPDIERFAPERMTAVNDAVAAVKAQFDEGNYQAVITAVPGATSTVTAAAQAAADRKAQLSTSWAEFASMPAMVGQIKAKVAELKEARRLPRGMDRAKLESAESSLESVSDLWDEASDAHSNGDLAVAVSKANEAKPMVESLVTALGIEMPN